MKGIRLPRNMKITMDEDGKFKILITKTKMAIPLRVLEKRETLTPSMVEYLKEYETRLNKDEKGNITDTKTLERIRTILSKPTFKKDPIKEGLDLRVETRYSEAHYRRMGYKGYEDFKVKDAEIKAVEEKRRKEELDKKSKEVNKDAKPKK